MQNALKALALPKMYILTLGAWPTIHDNRLCLSLLNDRTKSTILRQEHLLAWFRQQLRASELWFVVLAVGVGCIAGAATVAQGATARTLRHPLFALPPTTRLSGLPALGWAQLAVLPLGGAVLALFSRVVHAPEAEADGRCSRGERTTRGAYDAARLACRRGTDVDLDGFGASVGLEAAYAQIGGAVASFAGRRLNLRRADLRALVEEQARAGLCQQLTVRR